MIPTVWITHLMKKKFQINANVKLHNAEQFPYPYEDNYFDLVYSKSFIEHFYYSEKVLMELYRILKPGGKIITSLQVGNICIKYFKFLYS